MRISDWSSDVCSSDLQRRRRCDRTVVIGVAQARAAGTVVAELALLALVDLHRALRAVAGGQAPDVLAVPLPVHRVLDRIGALCQRGAAAVLEVVDAARTHVLALAAAEIDPDPAVLVSELRREAQVFLAFEMPPPPASALGGP